MTKPESTPKKSAHERLMEAAMILFYNHGINGTGIDAIVERAGVAKKSLYNNFTSKADLVNQYLEARHARGHGSASLQSLMPIRITQNLLTNAAFAVVDY